MAQFEDNNNFLSLLFYILGGLSILCMISTLFGDVSDKYTIAFGVFAILFKNIGDSYESK